MLARQEYDARDKIGIWDKFWCDNYFVDTCRECERRGFIRWDDDLEEYSLVTSWDDVDRTREEVNAARLAAFAPNEAFSRIAADD